MAKKQNKLAQNKKNIYYPSLDGLRFFAFFVVFLHHSLAGTSSSNNFLNFFLIILNKNGWVGVDLFFVLSGYLITMILLRERQIFGKYSLKNFWIRRALRIWPLYYLALLFGFFITPFFYSHFFGINYSAPVYSYEIRTQLPLYLTFLGNWAVVFYNYSAFSNIGHLWTISLEEQFYFFWPLLLFFITSFKRAIIAGILIISFSIFVRALLVSQNVAHPGIYTNTFARVDILTLGTILALFNFYKPSLLNRFKFLFRLPTQIFIFSLLLAILYKIYLFDTSIARNVIFGYLIIGLFMSYFTLSALQIKTKFASFLSYSVFVYFGKISYGLYIWHILALEISFQILRLSPFQILRVPLALLLTLLFGYISYNFFEIKFLRLKKHFTKIKNRPI